MKRTINYLGTPTLVESKFVLISNCDGYLDTYHFDNFNDAANEMLDQLWTHIHTGMFTWAEWYAIKEQHKYSCEIFGFEVDYETFEYSCACTKFDNKPNCNWIIDEVTFVLD